MYSSQAELKQEIIRVNNEVNIAMYGTGLRKQRVYIIDNAVILIFADNKRIPALAALDRKSRVITRFIDLTLLEEFRDKLHTELKSQLKLPIKYVLKDYEPQNELAVTVVVLESAVQK
jgi:hypothetical protein